MKENFSNRVQNILKYAKEEAIRLGHSYVGSEHLLLGLLKEDSGLSYKILDIYDCSIVDIQSMICLLYTSPSPRDLSTSRMPSSA